MLHCHLHIEVKNRLMNFDRHHSLQNRYYNSKFFCTNRRNECKNEKLITKHVRGLFKLNAVNDRQKVEIKRVYLRKARSASNTQKKENSCMVKNRSQRFSSIHSFYNYLSIF